MTSDASGPALRQVLRHRGLMELTGSYMLIRLANTITGVALPLLLVDRFGFSPELGFTLAVQMLPSILLGPLIGGVVDRLRPARVAVGSALASAALALIFPFASKLGTLQLLVAALGLTYAFAFPARMALRSEVTPDGGERPVNSLMVGANRIPALIGPVFAALLVNLGTRWVFWTSAVIAAIAAGLLARILRGTGGRTPVPAEAAERAAGRDGGSLRRVGRLPRQIFIGTIAALWSAMRSDRLVQLLTAHTLLWMVASGLTRLYLPAVAVHTMPHHPGAYGYVAAAAATGGLLGAAVAGTGFFSRGGGHLYVALAVLEAFLYATLALPVGLVPLLALVALCTVCESIATVIFYAEVQRRIGKEYTGRFFATLMPVLDLASLVGTVTSGPVVAAGLRTAGGVIGLAFLIPILLLGPFLLRKRPWAAPAAHH